MIKRFFYASITVYFCQVALAGDLNLAWDPSTSKNVGGYKLYYGKQSKTYISAVDVGNITTYKITGLDDGVEYYFALKSYNTDRTLESAAYSNEVSTKTAGNVPITPPPVIAPLTLTKLGNLVVSSANNTLPDGATCNTYVEVTPSDAGKEALMAYKEHLLPPINGNCAVDASKYFVKGTKGYIGMTYSVGKDESFLSNILVIDLTESADYVLDTSLPISRNSVLSVDGVKGVMYLQSSFIPVGTVTDCLVSINGASPTKFKLTPLGKTQAYCKLEAPNTGFNKIIYSFVAPGTPPRKGADAVFNYKLKTPPNALCN